MTDTTHSHTQKAKQNSKKAILQALRFTKKDMVFVGMLFFITLLSWGIAEFSALLFQEKVHKEFQKIQASDITISSSFFPTQKERDALLTLTKKYNARTTESVEFPFTLEKASTPLSATNSGHIFTAVNIRIIDTNYPLYGSISYSGAFASGALAEG